MPGGWGSPTKLSTCCKKLQQSQETFWKLTTCLVLMHKTLGCRQVKIILLSICCLYLVNVWFLPVNKTQKKSRSILAAADADGCISKWVIYFSYWNKCCVITATQYLLCFWVSWWVTAKVIISLTHQKGWRREKSSIFSFCYFLSKGETLVLYCGRGHKMTHTLNGNRTSTLTNYFLYVLRECQLPLFNPVIKTVSSTWGAQRKLTIVYDD